MRRALVLTDETARHPFRASLPPHVCGLAIDDIEPRVAWHVPLFGDVRGFAQAYCASLLAIVAFIA